MTKLRRWAFKSDRRLSSMVKNTWNKMYELQIASVLPPYIDSVQFNRYINVSALKHYFNVSNGYVVNKLFLVLFPWRHTPWSRKQSIGPAGQEGWFLPPREDLNSPDMYIPGMIPSARLPQMERN
jgi:hypothetical protein